MDSLSSHGAIGASTPARDMAANNGLGAVSGSGVSWGAIFAGGLGAAALSLVLALLGTGLGMASISPWSREGISSTTFGVAAIAWLTFISLAASGVGGYLAGRLRTKWSGLHTTEVYFRDTAHGFLAWAFASLFSAVLLSSAAGSVAGTAADAAGALAAGAAGTVTTAAAGGVARAVGQQDGASDQAGLMGYSMDALFRQSDSPAASASGDAQGTVPVQEVTRIFARALQSGSMSPADAQYVGRLVSQRTGLTPDEAQKRVADTFTKVKAGIDEAKVKAREAADKARKATAYGSLWLVVSLLVGAFVASLCATWGGRQRDSSVISTI